MIEALIDKST